MDLSYVFLSEQCLILVYKVIMIGSEHSIGLTVLDDEPGTQTDGLDYQER